MSIYDIPKSAKSNMAFYWVTLVVIDCYDFIWHFTLLKPRLEIWEEMQTIDQFGNSLLTISVCVTMAFGESSCASIFNVLLAENFKVASSIWRGMIGKTHSHCSDNAQRCSCLRDEEDLTAITRRASNTRTYALNKPLLPIYLYCFLYSLCVDRLWSMSM